MCNLSRVCASVLLGIVPIVSLTVLILFLLSTLVTVRDFWNLKDPQPRAAELVDFLKNVVRIGASLALMYGASDWRWRSTRKVSVPVRLADSAI